MKSVPPLALRPPFAIEDEIYRTWCGIMRESVKPDIFPAGHMHRCYVTFPGGERDHKGQPCPIVAGNGAERNADPSLRHYTGAALHWKENSGIEVFFTDDTGNVRVSAFIPK